MLLAVALMLDAALPLALEFVYFIASRVYRNNIIQRDLCTQTTLTLVLTVIIAQEQQLVLCCSAAAVVPARDGGLLHKPTLRSITLL